MSNPDAASVPVLRAVVTLARDDSNGDFVILADGKEFRRFEMPSYRNLSEWEQLSALLPITMWRAFNAVFEDRRSKYG